MENPMILYFSSTGNSLYIAKKIKEQLGGNIFYIPNIADRCESAEKIIIVTPIYSFGIPVPVLDLLPHIDKKTEIIFVLNYGGMVGGADRLFYEYAVAFGLNVKSIYVLQMPENFTLIMSPPSFFINSILKSADKRIASVVTAIKQEKHNIPKQKRTHEKTYLKNKSNWHLMGERFSVNEKCVACKHCIDICPVGNISFRDGKIVFGNKCIACCGCFHRCPQKAIIYKGKDNKKRYLNPNIKETDIGKDF